VLRRVRGRGTYAQPTLLSTTATLGNKFPLGPGTELVVWDQILEQQLQANTEDGIDNGRFQIPADCPIESGAVLTGTPFVPVLVAEKDRRMVCDGSGALWSSGFVVNQAAERILGCLRRAAGRDEIGAELDLLLDLVNTECGLGSLVREGRRLGVVERIRRSRPGRRPGLLDARVINLDPQHREPCLKAMLYRDAAPLNEDFQIHVTLRSAYSVILDRLVSLPAGTPNVVIESSAHITNIEFTAFDCRNNQIVDQFQMQFCQGANFNVLAHWQSDLLPQPFEGAPQSEDLQKRTRVYSASFKGPTGGNRSGGLDNLLGNRELFDSFIGVESCQRETNWFGTGLEPQIDVIRWIKEHFEHPTVGAAFLVDPFLGSEALKRVILRQGSETLSLTIVVSPGAVNPDAAQLNAAGNPDEYLHSLAATATGLASQLCGSIRIVHVRRASGRSQAFHDRFLGLIDKRGVPRVYLLSNSLSKAAGDWPFAIVELDRVTSWTIARYVDDLLAGNDRGRPLHTEEIWSSMGGTSADAAQGRRAEEASAATDPFGTFRRSIRDTSLALHALEIGRAGAAPDGAQSALNKLIADWPETAHTPEVFAQIIVDTVLGGEQHAATIADRLKDEQKLQAVGLAVDSILLEGLMKRLSVADELPMNLPIMDRPALLHRAGRTIANRARGTDLVRDRINPILFRYIGLIETGRSSGDDRPLQMLTAGLCLVITGLEVACSATQAPTHYRIGIANDYIHFLGRLLRSWVSEQIFANLGEWRPVRDWELYVREAIGLVKSLHAEFGSAIEDALEHLVSDSMVPQTIREQFDNAAGLKAARN
jgi:hypothetical protein